MAFTEVTVTATYTYPGPDIEPIPASGKVTFTLSTTIDDDETIVKPKPVVATLDTDGSIGVKLVANNDATTNPIGSYYTVTEKISGTKPVTYNLMLDFNVTTVDLSTIDRGAGAPPAVLSSSVVLYSPNGHRWIQTVANDGTPTWTDIGL